MKYINRTIIYLGVCLDGERISETIALFELVVENIYFSVASSTTEEAQFM
jgi:hypothetical protein